MTRRFRWVECQLEALHKCRTTASLATTLASLPKTLDETYERILTQLEDEDRELAVVAMQWLTFSVRPLRLLELADVLALRPGPVLDALFTPGDVLVICSSLVTLDNDGYLKFSHFTVKEYLLSNRILNSKVSAFAVYEKQAIRCIVERSIAYLCLFDRPDSLTTIDTTHKSLVGSPYTLKQFAADEDLCESFSSRSSVVKPYVKCYRTDQTKRDLLSIAIRLEHRLLDYASLYWTRHVQQLSPSDIQELSNVFVPFFCDAQTYLNWIAVRDMNAMASHLKNSTVIARFPGRLALGLQLGLIDAVASLMMKNELDYSMESPLKSEEIEIMRDTLTHVPSSKTESFCMTAILLNHMHPKILETLDLEKITASLEGGDKDLLKYFRATLAALGPIYSSNSCGQRPTLIKLLLQNDCLEFLMRLVNDQDKFSLSWLCFAIRTCSDRCVEFLVNISPRNLWAAEAYLVPEVPSPKPIDLRLNDNIHPLLLAVEVKRPTILQTLIQHGQNNSQGSKVDKTSLMYELALRTTMDELGSRISSDHLKTREELLSTISNLASQIRGFDVKGSHLHLFCKALKTCDKAVVGRLIKAHKLARIDFAASEHLSEPKLTLGPGETSYWEFRMQEAIEIRSYLEDQETERPDSLLFCELGFQCPPRTYNAEMTAIYRVDGLARTKMIDGELEASYDGLLRRLIEGSATDYEAEILGLSLREDFWHRQRPVLDMGYPRRQPSEATDSGSEDTGVPVGNTDVGKSDTINKDDYAIANLVVDKFERYKIKMDMPSTSRSMSVTSEPRRQWRK